MWNTFLTSNDTSMRLLRTILQGVIGVLIANADILIGSFSFTPEVKTIIVGLTMAILSPIMAEIGRSMSTNMEEIAEPVEGDTGAVISDEIDRNSFVG